MSSDVSYYMISYSEGPFQEAMAPGCEQKCPLYVSPLLCPAHSVSYLE